MEEKSHVALEQCFFCMKDKGVLIDRTLRPTLPHRVCLGHEPCDECNKLMDQGVILISVDEGKTTDPKNPWRTGGWVVLKDEALGRILSECELLKQILRKRAAFVPDDAWWMLGLPGIKAVRGHVCRKCGHEWTTDVTRGDTPNISGEPTEWCPKCDARWGRSSPWRYVREEDNDG